MTVLPFAEKIGAQTRGRIRDAGFSSIELGDNYQQVQEIGLNPQHEEWDLAWAPLTDTEYLTLRGVLDTLRCVGVFSWTAPLGSQKNYRRLPDSLNAQPLGAGLWGVSISIREVNVP